MKKKNDIKKKANGNPQKEDGYTPIANELADAFCRYFPGFSTGQVLWAILRKTYGWQKLEDKISITQLVTMTSCAPRTVIYALQELEAKKIILIKRVRLGKKNEINVIRLNKNYNSWIVQNSATQVAKNRMLAKKSSAKLREKKGSAKLTKKVVQNSQKKVKSFAHTIETFTKDNTKEILRATPAEEFNFIEKLTSMVENTRDKRMPIIAHYWNIKHINFENKEQYESGLKRELIPSGNLVGYSLERIDSVMNRLKKTATYKWTLETVWKFIDEPQGYSIDQEIVDLIKSNGGDSNAAMFDFNRIYGEEITKQNYSKFNNN